MAKERLDKLLVARGLCPTRTRAQALILSGKVLIDERVVDKAGTLVAEDQTIRLKQADHPYVSRGALKLVKGLEHFEVSPKGWTCIDVGASTGGFTDVLLRREAARVYAVDVGYGQLAWSIRSHDRVVNLERQNIRHLEAEQIPEPCQLAVIDTSFISLRIVLPHVVPFLTPDGQIIALVKPQFEVGKGQVGRGGVVRDRDQRLQVVNEIRAFATNDLELRVTGMVESPITGPKGNVEFLLHLKR